ncbi:aerolysin-like protein [Colletotrichum spaethianum]|uniref:Aerolysin-like protein n=1 Tax=Colletotrichum spaethianum TaxID=700344 RepID=A0AA37P238_9PEZI|nr:aerolysin-like protein [Colletotrichum spaethianum]GKT45803.1 aerolysin-like protein [Colletotrichum spaethianum]
MFYSTLFLKHVLLGAIFLRGLAFASPIGSLDSRAVKVIDTPLAQITPNIISHGPLDDKALERLRNSLTISVRPTSTPEPDRVKRQLSPSSTVQGSLTITTKDAFVSVDVGDINIIDANPANCHSEEINGPIDVLQVFMGAANIRAMNVTSSSGNTTRILSRLIDTSTDAGVFTFENGDRIKDLYIWENRGSILGFNFTTTSGATYVAQVAPYEGQPSMVKVPVGSGILGRIRVQYCNIGLVGHLGFDFLDDLQSVSISNIAYSGFTDDIMPAGPGQTMTVGSQIVDNRNSTAEQIITLSTIDAVTKSHTISVANQWNVGGRVAVEAEAGIPLIGKSKVTTEFNWQVQKTTTEEDTEGETLTKSAIINLKCPAKKYCVGTSFFTIFKMDVDVEATFRAKTKSGKEFFWKQKGKYEGADSLALQLQVDEADGVIGKRLIGARRL